MSSRGTKVTDPNVLLQEGTGAVTSDSLAAESARAGGAFSDNPNSTPQGVSGANSTFANTNTSGAIRLDPASDAEARLAQDDLAEKRYPESDGGQAKGLAVENTQGSYQTGGASSNAGMAPSYVTSQYVDAGGPKGRNLTEGGFESNDSKNASFNSEVGTKRDPGRAAELKFQTENADTAGNAAIPAQGAAGDAPYDKLQPETSA